MWLDDLASHLAALNISGVHDEVFVHTIPPTLDQGVMLTSPLAGIKVDTELPGFHRGALQVVVRAKKSSTAEGIAQAVSDVIEIMPLELDTVKFNHINPRHLPIVFPRSDGDFYEASVNFDICFVRLSA